ncbi:glycerate kinase [Pseudolysinimonas yzui]|uniref:Glycerate kinase n=1 Tax=Pseudolysinimonas yzui TaxID=2708254 RepID=A0A8J3M372_9MICO|nr:glycerate kinase [Pseudolysinimonas yzui]GHF27085.1 glycerate kinase [Pseudolysinimonas yzui]
MTRVVIAPDSFKGTATARDAARAIARGWASVRPDDELVLAPQADGGEGTIDAVAAAVAGAEVRTATVTGPDGRDVEARWLLLDSGEAVLELAESSGLPLMDELDPLGAGTRGLGELIGVALDAGATALTVGLGGSASTDGGAGALAALGMTLADASGRPLPDGGGALSQVEHLDRRGLRPPPPGGVRLLTDVTAPLLGPSGAAAVFGPQKGAGPGEVAELDAALARFAHLLGGDPTASGTGAAGGTGYGLSAGWGATLVPGAPTIADLSGLPALVAAADVVISGEGRFDATSIDGKVVGHVLGLIPPTAHAVVIAGALGADPVVLTGRSATAIALDALAPTADAARADALHWLEVAGARAAELSSRG